MGSELRILTFTYDPRSDGLEPFALYRFRVWPGSIQRSTELLLPLTPDAPAELERIVRLLAETGEFDAPVELLLYRLRNVGLGRPGEILELMADFDFRPWFDGAAAEAVADIRQQLASLAPPIFPKEVIRIVEECLPGHRLPTISDLTGDWSRAYDPRSLSPFLASGGFTDPTVSETAFFVIREGGGYKAVVLCSGNKLVELASGEGSPANLYLGTVDPGTVEIGKSARVDGGPTQIVLARQAIQFGTYESASCVFYWDEEKAGFTQQWVSD